MELAPDLDEYFLYQVVGIIVIQHHPPDLPINLLLVNTNQELETLNLGFFNLEQVQYLPIRMCFQCAATN